MDLATHRRSGARLRADRHGELTDGCLALPLGPGRSSDVISGASRQSDGDQADEAVLIVS